MQQILTFLNIYVILTLPPFPRKGGEVGVINCESQAALHERLETAAARGNLPANLSEEAMRVFWPAETNPMYTFVDIEEPVLMRWLVAERFKRSWSVFGMSSIPCENIAIKEFGRFLGEGVEEFFRRFIADVRIAPRTIFNAELLKLIPAERRTMYFRDVYEKYSNTKFFGIRQFARAAAVGVDKVVLQELLLARIETIPAPKPGIGSELSEFVELRAELIPSNLLTAAQKLLPQEDKRRWWTGEYSPWEVLTNEQLFGAMRTCAQKIPESILGRTQVLALRLNEAQIGELCELAANQLSHVSWDSAFRRYVSEATRFALLERCLVEPHGSQYGIVVLVREPGGTVRHQYTRYNPGYQVKTDTAAVTAAVA